MALKHQTIFLVFSCCLFFSKAETSLDVLAKASQQSANNILHLDSTTFSQYLQAKRPANYDIVILFSIKADCAICREVEEVFEAIATSYRSQSTDMSHPLFFALMEYNSRNAPIFERYSLKSVPILVVSTEPLDKTQLPPMSTWMFSSNAQDLESSIVDYINKHTSQNIVLKKSFVVSLIRMLIALTILGFLVYATIMLRWLIATPVAWLVVSFVIFLICCGGTVHNYLHKTPMMGYSRGSDGQSEHEYISTGQREQYALEGYIASGLMLLVGGSFILAFFIIEMKLMANRRLYGYIILSVGFIALFCLLKIYTMKSPWYGPTFAPPDNYIKGPLSRDQGNNI